MGREVRRVPADWQHPRRPDGSYIGLYDNYRAAAEDWDTQSANWAAGICPEYADEEDRKGTYEDWDGPRPDPADYMPDWPAEQRTHYMMYENTSEGSPISPAIATPEELAQWLVDNNANAFAGMTASYEHWLHIARGAYALGCAICNGVTMTGVEFAYHVDKLKNNEADM